MNVAQPHHSAHSQKVSEISGLLAGYAGYSPETAGLIRQAAQYHDVGKSEIDPAILNKLGRLTPQEYDTVKTHAELGARRIDRALEILAAAKIIAEQHHEKICGLGYPHGLSGNAIHPYSRIVAVADVYDALASKRAYKGAWDTGDILRYMESESGTHFDGSIIRLLLAHSDEVAALYQ
jgi:HD-GYP domain-containing protein (c-di-GMP phosphodiesterase class II)